MQKNKSKWKIECDAFFDSNVEGKQVLDVGCGKYPHAKATKTLDVGTQFNPDVVADVNIALPLPDNSFDCIVMNNVLEHLHNPKHALAECRRVLKKGGVMLVAVPFLIKIHQEPHDYHRYTKYMLERLFKDFQYTVTPSELNLTYLYKSTQNDLFGMIGKGRPVAFIVSRVIRLLTPFLPDLYDDSYPKGYFVIARKM